MKFNSKSIKSNFVVKIIVQVAAEIPPTFKTHICVMQVN